jgi:SAM-dependent methyltransferase
MAHTEAMWSSLSGGVLGRLVILFITASLFWACGKSEPRCVAGTAGCECAHPQACGEGLECRWDICYGGEVKPPDTYFYTDRSLQDYDDTKRLIQTHLNLSPGDHVADIGCGKGSMTVAMSRLIGPSGKAYATDIDTSALTRTRENLEANTNAQYSPLMTSLATSPRDTGLDQVPDGTLRVMLMINSVYFERDESQDDAAEYMGRFMAKLAPGGRLIYHFDWIEPQRLTRDETVALMVKAGFSPKVIDIPMLPHIPPETYVVSGGLQAAVPKPLKRGFITVFTRPEGP